jgi:hypothetical protein
MEEQRLKTMRKIEDRVFKILEFYPLHKDQANSLTPLPNNFCRQKHFCMDAEPQFKMRTRAIPVGF